MNKFKTFTLLLGVLLLASTTSCKKDGVYTPSKKIQRVYISSTYTNKYLRQSWDWDGKLIKDIKYYNSNGSLNWTADYSYEGQRVVRIDDYLNSEYTTFDYNGKHLKTVNYYYRNNLDASSDLTFKNNKLENIMTTYYGTKGVGRNLMKTSFLPLPEDVCEIMDICLAKVFENNESKSVGVINWKLTWDGNNISKIDASLGSEWIGISLQYDNKNCPLNGFYDLYSFVDDEIILDGGMMSYSKNNITKAVINDSDGDNTILTFTYQYDNNNYPIMRIQQLSDDGDYKYITYYEY